MWLSLDSILQLSPGHLPYTKWLWRLCPSSLAPAAHRMPTQFTRQWKDRDLAMAYDGMRPLTIYIKRIAIAAFALTSLLTFVIQSANHLTLRPKPFQIRSTSFAAETTIHNEVLHHRLFVCRYAFLRCGRSSCAIVWEQQRFSLRTTKRYSPNCPLTIRCLDWSCPL